VAADLKDALAPVKSKNFASVVDPIRVGKLMRAIYGYSGHPVTALALKLAPLLFVRPGELRQADGGKSTQARDVRQAKSISRDLKEADKR
jgi:hypothetical protein